MTSSRELATSTASAEAGVAAAEAAAAASAPATRPRSARARPTRCSSPERPEATNPEVTLARARANQARVNLERTVIRAPVDGVVAKRSVQVGQQIQAGVPVLQVVPVSSVHVDANFKEVQLARVRIGQPVEVTSDLYGHSVKYHGVVAGLSGGTGSTFATIPAQKRGRQLDQGGSARAGAHPAGSAELAGAPLQVGLSMNATIDSRNEKGWGLHRDRIGTRNVWRRAAERAACCGAAAIVLATANFIAVLDTDDRQRCPCRTSPAAWRSAPVRGAWVITSYSVAEAIIVPLTGWLAGRFGAVRVFVTAMGLFGVFSTVCGMSSSLGMLVAGRILQGLAGGPLMPLSQNVAAADIPQRRPPLPLRSGR